jgi:hypothetical protein
LHVCLQGVRLPVLLPGAKQAFVPLSPSLSDEDKQVVENVVKIGERGTHHCLSIRGTALLEVYRHVPSAYGSVRMIDIS